MVDSFDVVNEAIDPDTGRLHDTVLRRLEGMRQRGTPVIALGIQSHSGSKLAPKPMGDAIAAAFTVAPRQPTRA